MLKTLIFSLLSLSASKPKAIDEKTVILWDEKPGGDNSYVSHEISLWLPEDQFYSEGEDTCESSGDFTLSSSIIPEVNGIPVVESVEIWETVQTYCIVSANLSIIILLCFIAACLIVRSKFWSGLIGSCVVSDTKLEDA